MPGCNQLVPMSGHVEDSETAKKKKECNYPRLPSSRLILLLVNSTNIRLVICHFSGPSVNPCQSIPCLNGGNCQVIGNIFTCSCLAGFVGTRCETGTVFADK